MISARLGGVGASGRLLLHRGDDRLEEREANARGWKFRASSRTPSLESPLGVYYSGSIFGSALPETRTASKLTGANAEVGSQDTGR